MTLEIFHNILNQIGIYRSKINNVAIHGNDPILPSPFLIGSAGAATIAVIGYLASAGYSSWLN